MFNMRQHLESRHFNPELYTGCTVMEDEMTVMLFNLSGQICGYQVYSPHKPKKAKEPRDCKYFTHLTEGQNAVWGLETLEHRYPYLFITEGIFDACRLHTVGLPAVAVLGSNPQHLLSWFTALPQEIIACCQGDKAGLLLALSADQAIFLPEGEDVGSLSDEKFYEIFRNYLDPDPIV